MPAPQKEIRNIKRSLSTILWVVGLLSLLVGCSHNIVYENDFSIHKDSWRSADTLKFPVNVSDTTTPLSFYFNVRNTTKYSFSNLYMYVTTYYPNNTYSRDTVECWLAAPDGRWLGKGLGRLKDNEFTFRKNIRMPMKGQYVLAINQAMRHSPLIGIANVGLRVETQKSN